MVCGVGLLLPRRLAAADGAGEEKSTLELHIFNRKVSTFICTSPLFVGASPCRHSSVVEGTWLSDDMRSRRNHPRPNRHRQISLTSCEKHAGWIPAISPRKPVVLTPVSSHQPIGQRKSSPTFAFAKSHRKFSERASSRRARRSGALVPDGCAAGHGLFPRHGSRSRGTGTSSGINVSKQGRLGRGLLIDHYSRCESAAA